MGALDRKLLRELHHLRSQLLAVALVVACGIALFVALRSMHGYLVSTQVGYYADYRFADVFAQVRRAPRSLLPRIQRLPGVAAVQARVVRDVTLDVPGLTEPAVGRLISIPERRAPILNDLHLRSGRWPAPGRRDEVIASDAFARANRLRPGDGFGAVLNGRWQRLRVVGTAISPEYIYEIRGAGDVFPDNRRFGVLWLPEPAMAAAFDMRGAFNDLSLTLAPRASEPAVIAALDALLQRYGALGAYGRGDHVSHEFVSSEIEETQVTSVMIPAIFLGVTAFLLHLVLSRLVGTQRDQIGVLKAFGYGEAPIALHYLKLAAVPVAVGAVVGIGFGLWFAREIAQLYARFYQFPVLRYRQDWGVVGLALLVGAAALLGAMSAVRRAVRLPPAEAMRPEAPARFRPGALERAGLRRLLSPAARIVVRNLERQPVRTLLSVLGIALAVAILVVGRYMFDAIDLMRRLQFEAAQREAVTVVFEAPRPAAAAHALARLPGVLRAEPFRAVPVRLRSGHHAYRTALMGLPAGGELRRIVGSDGRPRAVPADGVLLSAKLAELLAVRPGDSLRVEVLEGARPTRSLRVAGTVDELIGTSAYVERRALNRLLGEGATLSGGFLAVDARRAEALYTELKRMPAVGGVAVTEAARRGFQQTVAESFRISIVVIIFFACIIAFGMVYNSARIALSERGRELASLRVLGFTRREVAAMLFGEQALLTLLAIPLGFLLGYGLCALIALRFDSELFRVPLVVSPHSFAFAALVVLAAALLSGLAVRHRLDRLDLIAVLKTRE